MHGSKVGNREIKRGENEREGQHVYSISGSCALDRTDQASPRRMIDHSKVVGSTAITSFHETNPSPVFDARAEGDRLLCAVLRMAYVALRGRVAGVG